MCNIYALNIFVIIRNLKSKYIKLWYYIMLRKNHIMWEDVISIDDNR